MIELQNVSYGYGGETALKDFSYSFEKGKCYVIQGPNGCGKSTLFRILNGLSFASRGKYLFDGEEITEKYLRDKQHAYDFHRRIGFAFQRSEIQLFCSTVEEEIAFGLWQLGLSEEEVHRRTEEYLRQLSLENVRYRMPVNLSGGEQKRCALASVLAMEPEVVILDEPESGLDEDGQEWVRKFLTELKSPERLLIVATHSKEFARDLADVRLYMNREHSLDHAEK
ncbi:MAG: ABC transporter ATP-binding protein [Eubacterium sp.]|nr:ABC transporter ATP-binding protein [Eubacterium sp.]